MNTEVTEKFEVRNRWTDAVQFTAEITCRPDASYGVKLGLAVVWGHKNKADLRGADLRDAVLRGADLRGADLRGADLSGAVLRDADLSGAVLRQFKSDFWMILTMARPEIPALIEALREGRVDGSTYEGECACLVGTLENSGASGLPRAASSPAEAWFAPIRKGIKPGDDNEGGWRSQIALDWALEYCRLTGIEIEEGA